MKQENILEKMKNAGITNEAVSAETMMERMIKEKSRVLQIGKSLIIVDPNGKIMEHTAADFKKENYEVKALDFVHMEERNHYNLLYYLRNEAEVMSFARYLVNKMGKNEESFMVGSEIALLTAFICYVKMERSKKEQNLTSILKMIRSYNIDPRDPNSTSSTSALDTLFDNLSNRNQEHIAVRQWKIFKLNDQCDQKRILTSLAAKLSVFDLAAVERLTKTDDIELNKIKDQKTVLFVMIPATDDSYDILADLLHFQLLTMLDCDCISGWTDEEKLLKDIREISSFVDSFIAEESWNFENKEK